MLLETLRLIYRGIGLAAPTVVVSIFGVLILFAIVMILRIFLPEEEEKAEQIYDS